MRYAPYEQPDFERGEQAIARYDATKLGADRLHVLTVDVMFRPVWLGSLTVSG
jgi:hypothetical protein